jgi:ribose transport system substrate-binding protein
MRWQYLALAAICLAAAGCNAASNHYKYRIAVIPKGLTHAHWQSIHRGALRAADDLKATGISVEILWDGPLKESETLEQINIVNRNIGARVSGIILAPQHSVEMVPPVERAVSAGIPVVILDSGLARDDRIVQYVATDNYRGGQLAAQHLLKVLEEMGKLDPRLVLFRYQVGSESTVQREQGFLDHVQAVVEKRRFAGQPFPLIVSQDKYAGATVDTAEREAGPLLTQLRGQIDGIFAVNESSANGMLNALRSQRLNRQVTLVGFDCSEPLLQAVEEGDIAGLIVQDPYRMGYLGVWSLVHHLEGLDVCPDGKKTISTGEYVLTRDNLHSPATRERFDPELQARRVIAAPAYGKKTE